LAQRVDVLFVVGSHGSANTRKLAETCCATGVRTHSIESAGEIEDSWFHEGERLGVTAGASTPDDVIQDVVRRLERGAAASGTGRST
jgi:4-hydroxy-3-methylbut-2-enyl diphosphate reductase